MIMYNKHLKTEGVIKTLKTIKQAKDLYTIFNPVIDILYDITVLKNNKSISSEDKRNKIKRSSIELYNLSKNSKLDDMYVDIIKAIAIIINKHA